MRVRLGVGWRGLSAWTRRILRPLRLVCWWRRSESPAVDEAWREALARESRIARRELEAAVEKLDADLALRSGRLTRLAVIRERRVGGTTRWERVEEAEWRS
jgi:hypothetical protein